MVHPYTFSPGFILFPLYIYPFLNAWNPLFNASTTYPTSTFLAVINYDNGPSNTSCPNSDYITAMKALNTHQNIVALGYVYTLEATRPLADLQTDINRYQNWSSATTASGCGIQINGIFFDQAPTAASSVPYMKNISAYARKTLTHGSTIVYNPGVAVDPGYWQWADFINVFEDTEAKYDAADIGALDGGGNYSQQATLLIHTYTSSSQTEENDVDTIIDTEHDAIAGVFITNRSYAENPYSGFPSRWANLAEWVDAAN